MVRTAKHVRTRLMLFVCMTTLVAMIVSGVALLVYELRTYQQSWVDDLVTQAHILGQSSAAALSFDDAKVAQENLDLLALRPQISLAAIYEADGHVFASYRNSKDATTALPVRPEESGYRIENNRIQVFQRVEQAGEFVGTVYISAPYPLFERMKNYLSLQAGVMVISLIIALMISMRLQRSFTRPILEIADVASQVMARKDFSLRVKKTEDDEIGYLVDAFNAMLNEVGQTTAALKLSNETLEHEMQIRREAETALIAADQRKDEFLATLAHELRNPLAPLSNALHLLRIMGTDPDKARFAYEMMDRQLKQMVRLVDDLLDVSRITTGKLILRKEQVTLQTVLQNALEAARPFIDLREQKLTVEIPAETITMQADPVRLGQVFINLLNNAAKFTEIGGAIKVRAHLHTQSHAGLQQQRVTIEVSDSGVGIAAEMLGPIFNMFSQAEGSLDVPHNGLGVGLTLARHLVTLHGGTIDARSEGLGKGSTFFIDLPLSEPVAMPVKASAPTPALAVPATPITDRLRILLVDDNRDFVDSLVVLLESMGHDVRVAYDGAAGLQSAIAFAPHLLFLDIGMPKLSGYDLAKYLRQLPETENSMFVAVTGWGQAEDKRRAKEAGFNYHIVKPANLEQITAIIELCMQPV